jgi:hypothetical protein
VGGYVREIEARVEFDGETVVARLKPVKFMDAMDLMAFKDDQTKFIKGLQAVLSTYLIELRGPTAADGTQVAPDEFLSSMYFSNAVVAIGTQWVQKAFPSNPPSPGA